MSSSPLVTALAKRLQAAGYEDVATPFKVASVNFEFTWVLRGRAGRALDLVIVVDTMTGQAGDTDFTIVRRRIEALSRALDISGSRFVLTVVLAGAAASSEVEGLAETCRVLLVEPIQVELDGTPTDTYAAQQLDDRIRVLLPLEIPPREEAQGGEQTAEETLQKQLPVTLDQVFLKGLLDASRQGETAVEHELGRSIDAQMKTGDSP
ncbi:hypothetical protein ACCT26_12635 [Rhizobium ruizarguesonis]